MTNITYTLEIILDETGFAEEELLEMIEHEVISPFDHSNMMFDQEDLRRLVLVKQLKENCNPNMESLEVILHLLDQIHYLRRK